VKIKADHRVEIAKLEQNHDRELQRERNDSSKNVYMYCAIAFLVGIVLASLLPKLAA
jgi:hypothetical protein